MATITTSDARLHTLPPATGRAGLRGALASEFTKLRSVRSTYWALGALLIVSIGVGALVMGGESGSLTHNPANRAGFDGTQVSLIPFFEIGQLIIGVLGALTITSEYSTGMIRTSLTAMPRRGVVYAAKAIVFTCVTLVFALITSFVAFFVGQAMVASTGEGASLFGNVKIPANAIFTGPGGPGR
jgi:ABC-2 type transport system permease protein